MTLILLWSVVNSTAVLVPITVEMSSYSQKRVDVGARFGGTGEDGNQIFKG